VQTIAEPANAQAITRCSTVRWCVLTNRAPTSTRLLADANTKIQKILDDATS